MSIRTFPELIAKWQRKWLAVLTCCLGTDGNRVGSWRTPLGA